MKPSRSYLRTIEQAIKIGIQLRCSWFRGHEQTCWNLVPNAYRVQLDRRGGYMEYWAAERFRQRARSIEGKVPQWDEHLLWLLLMQHHGAPTRLLDWSENILTAVYFAVHKSNGSAGEVWCIRPDALNRLSNYSLCGPDRPFIRHLAADAFFQRKNELKKYTATVGIRTDTPKKPLGFLPPMEFARLWAQSSRFTIHPTPTEDNSIEALLAGPQEIICYEIPADCKASLRRDLISLGVTAEALYRSLDALSETIKDEIYLDDRCEQYVPPPLFD